MSKELGNSDLQKNDLQKFSDIPDGYFESLPERLMLKIDGQESQTAVYLFQRIAAIALILIVLAGLLIMRINTKKFNKQQFAYSRTISADTIRKSEPILKKAIVNDSTIANYQNTEILEDSLSIENLSDEEILQYILESEEFEF